MSYSATSDVAAFVPNLINACPNFDSTTLPTVAQVTRWLSAACSTINGRLSSMGYDVPVPGEAAIFDEVAELEVFYAVSRAELVRISARVSATERSRAQIFDQMFKDGLEDLLGRDLSRAGLDHTSKAYAGGISKADKLSVEGDTDRVEPRFSRGQFNAPDTVRPSGRGRDEESV